MSPSPKASAYSVAIIGAGPAGLMAAEALSQGMMGSRIDRVDVNVNVYDAMPSAARKFLMAGKGGLNLTHSEPREDFLSRYGSRRAWIEPLLEAFGPQDLRDWASGLGIATFVGSSGRVFPAEMKAAPLLRAWLHRLRQSGVRFHMRHRWCGWDNPVAGKGRLCFDTPEGEQWVRADAVILALGGGSWARLGSDGAWVPLLAQAGVAVAALRPSNCGFNVAGGWSAHFQERFAGQPVKPVVVGFTDASGHVQRKQGEFVVTSSGVEGGLIYALSADMRDEIAASGCVTIQLDLAPGRELPHLIEEVSRPRGSRSISSHLQSRLGIKGVKTGLLRELLPAQDFADPARLAAAIKALPLRLDATRPLDEAISSAGGVAFESLDARLMLRALPGVFCAGEMLDWEAPTGGYLLTACCASGRAAGLGALDWLGRADQDKSGLTSGATDAGAD